MPYSGLGIGPNTKFIEGFVIYGYGKCSSLFEMYVNLPPITGNTIYSLYFSQTKILVHAAVHSEYVKAIPYDIKLRSVERSIDL
jgi:hypothetical protein